MSQLKELETAIASAMHADQFGMRKLLRSIRQAEHAGRPSAKQLETLRTRLERSVRQREERAALRPVLKWDLQLPVVEARQEIGAAIESHQVIVVCGETGSGKSTQLPRIALELGRGIAGTIGHTQPRRIAARSIAARVADEMNWTLGQEVGYRIRFSDSSGPRTLVRLMTDGIMLAETQTDRFLDQYDTIIVDEAHERSLNIDFLLGYLKRLLPKRQDLRLIITSATIDAERFAQHFSTDSHPVPVITVSGRNWPVEIRYHPPEEQQSSEDELDAMVAAVDQLAGCDSGHILVFLPTERDIREADKKLSGRRFPGDTPRQPTQIVPLFGRLSMADQDQVFRPYGHRRIVLATNVAESSLTVPGIRYVVDTGTARISRYSARSRIQRLPIEPISQASANQRAGRCGRVGPGICIRLYSEQDFLNRERFTPPEIQRTNLAAVILRTLHLKLGRIEDFPFIDPPGPTTIREGYRTLEELCAITADGQLTELGRRMARLPVDPRISRMILAAIDENALPEVLAVAAVLETQDPRDRPLEKQQQADTAHAAFRHADSDFLTLLNLWDTWQDRSRKLSGSQLRKWCQQNFLSWQRMREWVDVHRQLRDLLADSDDPVLRKAAAVRQERGRQRESGTQDFAAIHRSLMTGLLANLACRTPDGEYTGAGGIRLQIWPGSSLASKGPKWFVAAELVETSRRFARTIARIQPEWIEPLAQHLVSREYSEPHWDAAAGNVMAFEKVSLWGLPIVPRRKVAYARIDPIKSRELLIAHGLVEFGLLHGQTEDQRESDFAEEEEMLRRGTVARIAPGRATVAGQGNKSAEKGWGRDLPFLRHNDQVLQEIRAIQDRIRRHDLLPSDDWLFEFYDQQVPPDASDRERLRHWFQREVTRSPELLKLDLNQLTKPAEHDARATQFPEIASFGSMQLPLSYQLDPGTEADGVTVSVPLEGFEQLTENRLSWLVPGLLEQKVLALIRSLPRDMRRQLVPAPDTARQVAAELTFGRGNLLAEVAQRLSSIASAPIAASDFDLNGVPDHLKFNIRVVNDQQRIMAEGRDLTALRQSLLTVQQAAGQSSQPAATPAAEQQWHRQGFTAWDFADVPVSIAIQRAGIQLQSFPAVVDCESSVGLTLYQTAGEAAVVHRRGVRRLIQLTERRRLRAQIDHLPQIGNIRMLAATIRGLDLSTQLMLLMADRAYLSEPAVPRTSAAFQLCLQTGRNRLSLVAQELTQFLPALFDQLQQTRRALDQARGPGWDPLVQAMQEQLRQLVYPLFMMETPWPWLIQFPRYLQTIRHRLQRLGSGGLRTEQQLEAEFRPWLQRYETRRQQHQEQHRCDPMLDHYRWMLEEFRVSLFAQKLGTAIPVSTRKLEEHWQRVS